VFTSDADFFAVGGNRGLLVYDQLEDPTPGDIVEAVENIEQVYGDPSSILETVPGDWVRR